MEKAYQVKLKGFEGPLDLLLHLINQYEIDIYNIPMASITEQYMDYIHQMKRLELNIASDYLVMAATLIAIKSQMLLPNQEMTDDTEEYQEDPREELMDRLIEYRKYKEAAHKLKGKENEERQTFTRPPAMHENKNAQAIPSDEEKVTINDMLSAFEKMLQRKDLNSPKQITIEREEIPVEKRMHDILSEVKAHENGISFDQLITGDSRTQLVTTFIALLELMKNQEVYCRQKKQFDYLYVYAWRNTFGKR